LTNNVNKLKAKDGGRTHPQKLRHNGGSEGNGGHNGDNTRDRDGDFSEGDSIEEEDRSNGFHATQFSLSEEGKALATFNSHLEYKIERPRTPNMVSLIVSGLKWRGCY